MHQKLILSTAYFAPLCYYSELLKYQDIVLEQYEYFEKQTYRNRCYIYGANGRLALIIPIEGRKDKVAMKDIRISYHAPWQKIHWKSLEAAYRASPYFEYYMDDFIPYYNKPFTFLLDFNLQLNELILKLLKINKMIGLTSSYQTGIEFKGVDLRPNYYPGIKPGTLNPPYTQVFDSKHGFIPDLSIVDLLFNKGPEAVKYLREL